MKKQTKIDKNSKILSQNKTDVLSCKHYFEIEPYGIFLYTICRRCGKLGNKPTEYIRQIIDDINKYSQDIHEDESLGGRV